MDPSYQVKAIKEEEGSWWGKAKAKLKARVAWNKDYPFLSFLG